MDNNVFKRILIIFFFSLVLVVRPVSAVSSDMFSIKNVIVISGLIGGVVGAVISSLFIRNGDGGGNSGSVEVQAITASDIVFTEPKVENLVLTSYGKEPITVDYVLLVKDDLYNVSAGSIVDCQPILPGETCVIPLTATEDAYGKGYVVIGYGDGKYTASANVIVADIGLKLYGCDEREEVPPASGNYRCETWKTTPMPLSESIILEAENSPQFYKYTNNGNFSWQKDGARYVNWRPGDEFPSSADIALEENYTDPLSKCSELSIKPGESCVFTFTDEDGKDHPGDWGVLKAIGKNLTETNKNVLGLGGLEIVENLNPADQHLGCRSLKVENTVEGKSVALTELNILDSVTELDISDSIADGRIEYCSEGAVACKCKPESDPERYCKKNVTILGSTSSNNSCLIWFRAGPSPINSLEKNEDIGVTVEAKGTCSPACTDSEKAEEKDTFKMSYENALYVGGLFVSAGGQTAQYIAKWDGISWSSLAGWLSGTVYEFALDTNSDLYVGGSFTYSGLATNNIAKWNGTSWLSLGEGVNNGVNGVVHSLAMKGDDLYVGGDFTTAGGSSANRIAKWAEGSWSPLGTGSNNGVNNRVSTLANVGDYLYLGGWFTEMIGQPTSYRYIARWKPEDSTWHSLGTGVGYAVYSIIGVDDDIYAGGRFTSPASRVAKWNTTSGLWSSLGDGVNNYTYILTKAGDDIYVGGDFTDVGNRIAKWNLTSMSWLSLGSGVNGRVVALASVGDDLYVGGYFDKTGDDDPASCIAKWDMVSESWSPLGTGIRRGVVYSTPNVEALIIAPSLLVVEHLPDNN